jgi:uncharacterized membrane protein
MASTSPPAEAPAPLRRDRTLWAALMIGAGIMAAVDEIVFHQILAWHHFYDRGTPEAALVSDGLLHAAQLFVLIAGFFLLADTLRSRSFTRGALLAGLFLGLGGFQLFDGIVDHKVLRVHQIRYGVDLLPYDLAWNAGALVLLIVGGLLTAQLVRSRRNAGDNRSA